MVKMCLAMAKIPWTPFAWPSQPNTHCTVSASAGCNVVSSDRHLCTKATGTVAKTLTALLSFMVTGTSVAANACLEPVCLLHVYVCVDKPNKHEEEEESRVKS